MFNRLCFGALLLTGLVLSLNGCNTDSSSGLTTIVISPTNVTVSLAPPGYQQGYSQYTAIGYYGHAGHQTTQDITSQVTWASSDGQVATVSATGLATATGFNSQTGEGWVGNTFITASAPGYNGDIVSNTATFNVTDCTACADTDISTITVSPATQTVASLGVPVQFEAVGKTVSGNTVVLTNLSGIQWVSSVPSIAEATSSVSGVFETVGSGTTTITANFTNSDGSGASGSATLTVAPAGSPEPLTSMAVSPSAQTSLAVGDSADFLAIATTNESTTVNLTNQTATVSGHQIKAATWTSSNPSVASINAATGVAQALSAGVSVITAIAYNPDGTVVTGASTYTVTVSSGGTGSTEPLVSLAILPATQTSLTTGKAANVNFIAIGTTGSGGTVLLTNAKQTVNGQTIDPVTWLSSNPTVASFASSSVGTATPNSAGTTAITAIVSNPDNTVVTAVAAYTVSVPTTSEPLVSLAVLPATQTSLATGTGANVNFIAIGTTSSGATVDMTNKTYTDPVSGKVIPVAQWSSSNPAVASFASPTGGIATPNSNGAAAITAIVTNPDGTVVTGSASYSVSVPASTEPYVSLTIVPASQSLTSVGQQAQFLAIGTTGTGTAVDLTHQGVVWTSSDASGTIVKQVGTSNVFTAVANGAVAITATYANKLANGNAADLTSVSASGSISVSIGTPEPLLSLSILPNSQAVAGVGQQPTQFLAVGDFAASSSTPGSQNMTNGFVSGSTTYAVTWYSSNPAVAVVCNSAASGITNPTSCPSSTAGLVVAQGQGTTAITAISVDEKDQSGATAAATFTVTGAAVEPVSALSIFPGSPSITMPVVGSTTPATVDFIAIGTNGSTGLQTNVNSLTGIQWTSTNPLVASVSSSGVATAISAGSTTIAVSYTNPASAGSGIVTASTTLTVAAAASEPLTAVTIYPPSPAVSAPNQSSQLLAIGTFAAAPTTQDVTDGLTNPAITTTWSSSNPAVATVTTACPTGITAESCTLSACPAGSTGATCTTCPAGTVASGSSCVTKNLATPIGLVTGVSKGTAAIMALSANPDGSLVPGTTSFSVLGGSAETYTALTIYPGTQAASAPAQQSQFLVLGTSGTTGLTYDVTSLVQWCSSNATIATIESAVAGSATCSNVVGLSPGIATAKASGNTTFTATYTNPDNSQVIASATYTVTIGQAQEPLIAINVIPGDVTVTTTGQSAQFLAFGTYSTTPTVRDLTDQVTWYSSAPELATIESSGTSGETGGVATAMGYTGTSIIYAFDSNTDGTVVTSNAVSFTCLDPKTEICDPGPAPVLLATMTVYNSGSIYDTGENQSTWLVTAPDDQGDPNLIHCGPGSEIAGLGDSVCTGTYAVGSDVTLTAYLADPATGQQIAVDNTFGGWSSNCETTYGTPDLTSACTFPIETNTSVGAIFYSLALNCSATTSGTVGTAFNSTAITVSNGTGPYTFSTIGTLPAGLTLNTATGAVTGTPTAAGSFSITATDTNGTQASSASACAITIAQ